MITTFMLPPSSLYAALHFDPLFPLKGLGLNPDLTGFTDDIL
jgi:hypothetical protein